MKTLKLLPLILLLYNVGMSQKSDVSTLQKLYGVWFADFGETRIYELWKMNDNKLTGYSFKVFKGDTTFLETIVLEETDTGIYYIPTVPNQNEGKQVSFKLEKVENDGFHFINSQHDFPKRIIYTFKGLNELEVVIDDGQRVTKKRSTYKFQRLSDTRIDINIP